MKIIIANRDRTADLGPGLAADAERRMADPVHAPLPPALHAYALRESANEAEFLGRWTDLVRRKSHVDTLRFDIARRPGAVGALLHRVRRVLWAALRYQHDRVVTRQNIVNSHLVATLEFQGDEIRRLRERVEMLERRRQEGT